MEKIVTKIDLSHIKLKIIEIKRSKLKIQIKQ